MAGLARVQISGGRPGTGAAPARAYGSAQRLVQPYAPAPRKFDAACTRAAAPMVVAGSIAIAVGFCGLLWVGVSLLLVGSI